MVGEDKVAVCIHIPTVTQYSIGLVCRVERSAKVPSLRQARPDVPWGLEIVVRKCLDPDPKRRYQKAEDLAEDLRRLLSDDPLRHAADNRQSVLIRGAGTKMDWDARQAESMSCSAPAA